MRGETVKVAGAVVDNVLVHVGEQRTADEPTRPTGEVIAYTLQFPIGYPGAIHERTPIEVRGHMCQTVGFSDHERPGDVFGSWSGDWDMTVKVELVGGDMTAGLVVYERRTSRDDLGMPCSELVELWSGTGQARQLTGSEQVGTSQVTDAVETWSFVLPWDEGFRQLTPQAAVVEYDGARYDVTRIENIGQAWVMANMEAVRHV